jgi:3-hydroxyisobutyrate dehydrogenase-like beta-hydroxyacid dehydrogenase
MAGLEESRVIVVVGLGNMGLALARRLRMRGRDVLGVDPDPSRVTVWKVLSGQAGVPTIDDVDWPKVERVLLVVRTAQQLFETLAGVRKQAEAAGLRAIPLHVITTITPPEAKSLSDYSSPALRLIENSITGGEAPALLGIQTALLAGDFTPADVAFLRDGLMEEIVTFEQFGEPALAKLLNNLTCAYNLAAFGAVVKLGADNGLDVGKLSRVIVHGSGESYSARTVFSMIGDLLAKDVNLAKSFIGDAPLVDPDGIEAQLADLRARLESPKSRS